MIYVYNQLTDKIAGWLLGLKLVFWCLEITKEYMKSEFGIPSNFSVIFILTHALLQQAADCFNLRSTVFITYGPVVTLTGGLWHDVTVLDVDKVSELYKVFLDSILLKRLHTEYNLHIISLYTIRQMVPIVRSTLFAYK